MGQCRKSCQYHGEIKDTIVDQNKLPTCWIPIGFPIPSPIIFMNRSNTCSFQDLSKALVLCNSIWQKIIGIPTVLGYYHGHCNEYTVITTPPATK